MVWTLKTHPRQTLAVRWRPLSNWALIALATVVLSQAAAASAEPLQGLDSIARERAATEDFLSRHLSSTARQTPKVLWITGELRQRAEDILDHAFGPLRIRYWGEGERTLWILDEIGKELPITIGLVVDGDKIVDVKIIAFRETRGGEVRYPFFTDQFRGLGLDSDRENRLEGHIDGITGATLSVAAVRKIAILALVLHRQTPFRAP